VHDGLVIDYNPDGAAVREIAAADLHETGR
jgi:hypothetical protein